jgi:hypothetical protein
MPARGAKRTRSEKDIEAEKVRAQAHSEKCAKIEMARAAIRSARRAKECANIMPNVWIMDAPVDLMEDHVDELEDKEEDINLEELDDIIKSLKAFELHCKTKYAEKENKTATFFCPVCFVNKPIKTLHLLVPCGHGFCDTCTTQNKTNNCPNCRRVTDSVLKAYV